MNKNKRNLYLVMAEATITEGLLAMSIMTPFFHSVGLSNEKISLTQIIFTAVLVLLNVPTGYIADRISRKWANIIGDFASSIIFLCYAFTNNFLGIVICESLLGVTSALSSDVDQSLLKHFSGKLARGNGEPEESVLKKYTARLWCFKYISNLILLLLGGPIGAIDLCLAIALSGVPPFIGGVISIFIEDDSEKLTPKHKNPMKDMLSVARTALDSKPLRWRIFAYAVGRQMTHAIIWVATPLFIQAGVPLEFVSCAWAFNSLMAVLGAHLAGKFGHRLNDVQILVVPVALMSISMTTMFINLNLVTVWLYGLMGIVQGWSSSTLTPMVQRYVKPSEQTSVISLMKVFSDTLFIPTTWITGLVADIKLEYSLLATVAMFLPLGLIVIRQLKTTK